MALSELAKQGKHSVLSAHNYQDEEEEDDEEGAERTCPTWRSQGRGVEDNKPPPSQVNLGWWKNC